MHTFGLTWGWVNDGLSGKFVVKRLWLITDACLTNDCILCLEETGSYTCEYCGKQYKYFNPYQEHVALHAPMSKCSLHFSVLWCLSANGWNRAIDVCLIYKVYTALIIRYGDCASLFMKRNNQDHNSCLQWTLNCDCTRSPIIFVLRLSSHFSLSPALRRCCRVWHWKLFKVCWKYRNGSERL